MRTHVCLPTSSLSTVSQQTGQKRVSLLYFSLKAFLSVLTSPKAASVQTPSFLSPHKFSRLESCLSSPSRCRDPALISILIAWAGAQAPG